MGEVAIMRAKPRMPVHTDPAIPELKRAFDAAAPYYEEQFNSLPAAKRVRGIMWQTYLKYFRPGMKLLELNCGTGIDAVMLGQRGIHVHATDISEVMIEEAKKKITASHLEAFVTAGLLPFDDISRLAGYRFDGAYSNFGGLNCAGNLRPIALDLSELIPTGGILILCLMPDFALWETLSFLFRGRIREAFRRKAPLGTWANVYNHKVRTFYYSPNKASKAFEPFFSPVEIGGLNIFTPPPSSAGAYAVLGRLARVLETVDDIVHRTTPFSHIGDHYFLVLRRTGVVLNN
jgi:hypothetical protein